VLNATHFQEFTVNFDEAGLTVNDVNRQLLKRRFHGGKDVSKEFPELGQTALYCITEVHSKEEIDNLAKAIEQTIHGR
jgi:glycine dehydrogenase subunit 1